MRIRKRSQSVAPPVQPGACKRQQASLPRDSLMRPGCCSTGMVAECSNMQANRRLDDVGDHEQAGGSPRSSSDVYARPPVTGTLRLSDAHVERESDGDLSESLEHAVTDKGRRKQPPTKRRKIEHEPASLFEGLSSMTAAELLAVNELANGVRQRLAASEQSTSEQVRKTPPPKPSEVNSKDALISSIFYVYDTSGDNGLSGSEVVKYMLEHGLPGLKEGGARHTVQVANVLRSSSSFISLGDKKYLLCSTLDGRNESRKPTASTRQALNKKTTSPDGKDSSEESLAQTLNPRPRRRSGKKVQAEKPKSVPQAQAVKEEEHSKQVPSDGEVTELAVRVARRRGPSSSQKGKGPTQCKRYDGRGWQCSRLTEPGYSLCVHHQDLINKRAAKLKEQQTLSRLLESVNRKAATSQPPSSDGLKVTENQNEDSKSALSTKDNSISAAPVQKRKMLSLLAIK